jgi:histidine triad (HIT) family protein
MIELKEDATRSNCVFCDIIGKKLKATFIHEDPQAVAFKDVNPKAPTHVLVVPRRHLASLSQATESDEGLLGHLQLLAASLARQLGVDSGFRLVANNGRSAGQTVDHLHYHLLAGRPMQWPPG